MSAYIWHNAIENTHWSHMSRYHQMYQLATKLNLIIGVIIRYVKIRVNGYRCFMSRRLYHDISHNIYRMFLMFT